MGSKIRRLQTGKEAISAVAISYRGRWAATTARHLINCAITVSELYLLEVLRLCVEREAGSLNHGKH
jgi:hypothetical protein